MQTIVLSFRGEPLRMFTVRERPLEIGSSVHADVVVHEPTLPPRAWLVRPGDDGVLAALELASGREVRLVPGVEVPLGARYALALAPDLELSRSGERSLITEAISIASEEPGALVVVVGRGVDARRTPLGHHPLTIGSDPGADIVLRDRAVSGQHVRIEPDAHGAWVRDLGSRNGTHVDGVRTALGRIAAGSRIQLGRTELFIAEQGRKGDARSDGLVAASPAMIDVLGSVERFARMPFPVLIAGPSGAGKDGLARAIHARSPRRQGPFVAVNVGAVARDLVESELFGHERGAFTGAAQVRRGVFEQAHGGTLFLDEIGEIAPAVQVRLLRVLEAHEVRRVGGETPVPVDVRIVCATHRDLKMLVARGEFRADLFYRLVQLKLNVPALNERPEDVPVLAHHFLQLATSSLGPRTLTQDAIDTLVSYAWPGNVRELRNVVLAAATDSAGPIQRADVVRALERLAGPDALQDVSTVGARVLVDRHGSVAAAARALGIARTTLRDRLRREDVGDGRRRRSVA